jgi:hypothetical protein
LKKKTVPEQAVSQKGGHFDSADWAMSAKKAQGAGAAVSCIFEHWKGSLIFFCFLEKAVASAFAQIRDCFYIKSLVCTGG